MKNPIITLLLAVASAGTLPAAVSITVVNTVPNGTQSGGSGTGFGELSTSSGTISSNNGLPTTTYTVQGVDLTSVGGGSNATFTFTVTYTSTTNGSTPSTVNFTNTFGNVAVGGDNFVSGTETLTATIALTSSSFTGLSLTGFTNTRIGNLTTTGESGTLTHGGGTTPFANGSPNVIIYPISGNFVTYAVDGATTVNFEGFTAQFDAVPEPASASLVALGAVALLRRRRAA
ncbi:PEP-CTERM sorting domain-containing protein [Akkermansiaceae bacterium]|nr:PEP-CTERM sorting domain-containing protein [Akkermansiaceae bacterium]